MCQSVTKGKETCPSAACTVASHGRYPVYSGDRVWKRAKDVFGPHLKNDGRGMTNVCKELQKALEFTVVSSSEPKK